MYNNRCESEICLFNYKIPNSSPHHRSCSSRYSDIAVRYKLGTTTDGQCILKNYIIIAFSDVNAKYSGDIGAGKGITHGFIVHSIHGARTYNLESVNLYRNSSLLPRERRGAYLYQTGLRMAYVTMCVLLWGGYPVVCSVLARN